MATVLGNLRKHDAELVKQIEGYVTELAAAKAELDEAGLARVADAKEHELAYWKLHRECEDQIADLKLEHGRAVEPEAVKAELRDGLLRVALPKAGALKPRKIAVA